MAWTALRLLGFKAAELCPIYLDRERLVGITIGLARGQITVPSRTLKIGPYKHSPKRFVREWDGIKQQLIAMTESERQSVWHPSRVAQDPVAFCCRLIAMGLGDRVAAGVVNADLSPAHVDAVLARCREVSQ